MYMVTKDLSLGTFDCDLALTLVGPFLYLPPWGRGHLFLSSLSLHFTPHSPSLSSLTRCNMALLRLPSAQR